MEFKVSAAENPNVDYFSSLQEAKQHVDRYRYAENLCYSHIVRVQKKDNGYEEIGEYGEFWEKWEDDSDSDDDKCSCCDFSFYGDDDECTRCGNSWNDLPGENICNCSCVFCGKLLRDCRYTCDQNRKVSRAIAKSCF